MLAANHRLLQNREFTVEQRCRETLPPDLRADVSGESQRELRLGELAIGFKRAQQRLGRKPIARDALELRRKTRQCRLRKRQSRREGMASEAVDRPRRALGDEIECIAQVKSGDGPAGPAQRSVTRACEDNGRSVEPVLEA